MNDTDLKIYQEYHFFFYDASGPIVNLNLFELKSGIFVGRRQEELDIYCDRKIYHCLAADLFISKQVAESFLKRNIE